MRRVLSGVLILFSIIGVCACSQANEEQGEQVVNVTEEIDQMKEHAVDKDKSVSVATYVDDNDELVGYVDIKVIDTYVETEKIEKASLDFLKNHIGMFIDDAGMLLDGYSFVGVKLNINSEEDLNINTAGFTLKGTNNDEIFGAGCFYQDGQRISDDVHQGGVAKLQKGTTEITVGFFADENLMKCEEIFLIPTVFATEESQDNYIEITIQKGN